jgi:hypothetical protein
MAQSACFCGEDLNASGECWQGMISGGHQGNCTNCGKNALLDGLRCCSVECDRAVETRPKPICRACDCEIDEDGTCGCNPWDA